MTHTNATQTTTTTPENLETMGFLIRALASGGHLEQIALVAHGIGYAADRMLAERIAAGFIGVGLIVTARDLAGPPPAPPAAWTTATQDATAEQEAPPAWSGRCSCYSGHNSSSGRCTARNVTDPTRTGHSAICESCRKHCPCGNGPRAATQTA